MVVLESVDVNHATQSSVQNVVNMVRSRSTEVNAASSATVDHARWLNVHPNVLVDSVDTSRNTTNTDAESDVDANHVNQLLAQLDDVTGARS